MSAGPRTWSGRLALLAGARLLMLPAAGPVAAREPGPAAAFAPSTHIGTAPVGPRAAGLADPDDQAFDPTVATQPTDPRRIAVSYHR